MIFPGMDPYLEDPLLWPGVHAAFVIYLRDALQPKINPRYIASVEQRVYLEGPEPVFEKPERSPIPDVSIRAQPGRGGSGGAGVIEADAPVCVDAPLELHEGYITLLDLRTGQRIVTVIELVSPTNKYAGPGRVSYAQKQAEVLGSDAHLIEIDLLRAGPHVLSVPESIAHQRGRYDYLVSVNRARRDRRSFEFYPITLRQRLPRIRVPLADGDSDVALDLQAVLEQTWRTGSYHLQLGYEEAPDPPLGFADQQWADRLIATRPERSGQ